MIDFIKCKLIDVNKEYIIVECGNFGLLLFISLQTYYDLLNKKNTEIILYTHLNLNFAEENIKIFGFSTKKERDLFKLLTSISGIGNKTAIKILSKIDADKLIGYLIMKKFSQLKKIKGIGKRIAELLKNNLTDSMIKDFASQVSKENLERKRILTEIEKKQNLYNKIKNDALKGLIKLGYTKRKAELAIKNVMSKEKVESVESLIKLALIEIQKL